MHTQVYLVFYNSNKINIFSLIPFNFYKNKLSWKQPKILKIQTHYIHITRPLA